jgi:hypothetical protein
VRRNAGRAGRGRAPLLLPQLTVTSGGAVTFTPHEYLVCSAPNRSTLIFRVLPTLAGVISVSSCWACKNAPGETPGGDAPAAKREWPVASAVPAAAQASIINALQEDRETTVGRLWSKLPYDALHSGAFCRQLTCDQTHYDTCARSHPPAQRQGLQSDSSAGLWASGPAHRAADERATDACA